MEDKYLQDISDIKNMMNKSSQFISLSGLGWIMAGIYALIGAFIAHELIQNNNNVMVQIITTSYHFRKQYFQTNCFDCSCCIIFINCHCRITYL